MVNFENCKWFSKNEIVNQKMERYKAWYLSRVGSCAVLTAVIRNLSLETLDTDSTRSSRDYRYETYLKS